MYFIFSIITLYELNGRNFPTNYERTWSRPLQYLCRFSMVHRLSTQILICPSPNRYFIYMKGCGLNKKSSDVAIPVIMGTHPLNSSKPFSAL